MNKHVHIEKFNNGYVVRIITESETDQSMVFLTLEEVLEFIKEKL
jgi:hypothetical protein